MPPLLVTAHSTPGVAAKELRDGAVANASTSPVTSNVAGSRTAMVALGLSAMT